MKLVLATRNLGKVRELRDMLKSRCLQICSLQDFPDAPEVVEDGETYAENACKKANAIADYTGHLTLADDAGLEVAALNGAPGVHSKRWAGDNATDAMRIAKLLAALEGNPNRDARFVAAIAIAKPVPRDSAEFVGRGPVPRRADSTHVVIGVCKGYITLSPLGTDGFGYDPVFVPAGYDKTFAELGEECKNQISHRVKALQLVIPWLEREQHR